MRKIDKGTPVAGFNGNNFNNSCTTWSEFHKEHKEMYEKSRCVILTDEQKQLCGYTEIYIDDLKDCHIDHYKKRSLFPELTFEWNNLIAATNDSEFGAKYKDNKSGIQSNDYDNIFNPVTDNVENYFNYTAWGEVTPKTAISEMNNRKAKKTIEAFNLNHTSLKDRRKKLTNLIRSYREITKEDIFAVLKNYGFRSTINQILELN